MAIEPTCIHGLILRWCSLCRERRPAPKEPVQLTYGARGPDICAICEEPVAEGDVVMRLMPSGDVIHEYCP